MFLSWWPAWKHDLDHPGRATKENIGANINSLPRGHSVADKVFHEKLVLMPLFAHLFRTRGWSTGMVSLISLGLLSRQSHGGRV